MEVRTKGRIGGVGCPSPAWGEEPRGLPIGLDLAMTESINWLQALVAGIAHLQLKRRNNGGKRRETKDDGGFLYHYLQKISSNVVDDQEPLSFGAGSVSPVAVVALALANVLDYCGCLSRKEEQKQSSAVQPLTKGKSRRALGCGSRLCV